MDSFLKFIEEDIEAKKILISTMPVKTKGDIKKFNSRIETIESKYSVYKENVKKYIETKSKSFAIKKEFNNIETLEKNVKKYDEIKDVLNKYINEYYNINDDKDTWFNKMKELCDDLGYASDMKLYKENSDNYKGSFTVVTTDNFREFLK